MFIFCKEGKVFISQVSMNLTGGNCFSQKDQLLIKTDYGIFFPLTQKASNLIDYLSEGKKALFLNKNETLRGVLFGANNNIYTIIAKLNDFTNEIIIRVSIDKINPVENLNKFKFLNSSSVEVDAALRSLVYGDYTSADIYKVLNGLNFYGGAKELLEKEVTDGINIMEFFNPKEKRKPFINPDYK